MKKITDYLKSDQSENDINAFIVKVEHCADKAENHVAFGGDTPEYVSKAPKLRQLVVSVASARDEAAGGDKNKVEALKALVAHTQLCLDMNACHITMISLARNDLNILNNAGYQIKQKPGKTKSTVDVLDLTPEVTLKRTTVSGGVIVQIKRTKQRNVSAEIQMTDQDPNVEASWYSKGIYNKSRVEFKGFEPGKKIYFRVRFHADGGVGKWCPVVGIIVI